MIYFKYYIKTSEFEILDFIEIPFYYWTESYNLISFNLILRYSYPSSNNIMEGGIDIDNINNFIPLDISDITDNGIEFSHGKIINDVMKIVIRDYKLNKILEI